MTDQTNVDVLAAATDPNAGVDPYTELVGEGKKFKDNSALAKGKIEADKMIDQLKQETAELRESLKKVETAKPGEEAIKSLIERIEKTTGQNTQPGATLSREDIEKLVREGINGNETERAKRANYLLANAELNNHFKGDAATAAKHVNDRVAQLGMTPQSVKELAETNPKVFQALFVPSHRPTAPSNAMPPSRVGVLPSVGSEERGAKYYAKLRKELGHKFYEPALQQQRMADATRLGDRYHTT